MREKKPSRQLAWQRRKKAEGNCPCCGQKAAPGYILCPIHILKGRNPYKTRIGRPHKISTERLLVFARVMMGQSITGGQE